MAESPEAIVEAFDLEGYVADEDLATVLYLQLRLGKPVLLEGYPGVGKTEVANVLARCLNTELIRLQCHEGLDVHSAVYEWNYQKQLLSIKIQESGDLSTREKEALIFGPEFLLKRPLLRSITDEDRPPVLLVDEIDRADEEFEALLLELLSAFQISIPELGTVKAVHRPVVVLTSNRSRELSDALKRRCLYHWVDYPAREKELRIIEKRLPGIELALARQVVDAVRALRRRKLNKAPGVAEALDWAEALMALSVAALDPKTAERTLGCVLKSSADIELVKEEGVATLLAGT
jgi:MoxR-like ATPase